MSPFIPLSSIANLSYFDTTIQSDLPCLRCNSRTIGADHCSQQTGASSINSSSQQQQQQQQQQQHPSAAAAVYLRQCHFCLQGHPKSEFSSAQLRRGRNSCCRACVSAHPQGAGLWDTSDAKLRARDQSFLQFGMEHSLMDPALIAEWCCKLDLLERKQIHRRDLFPDLANSGAFSSDDDDDAAAERADDIAQLRLI